MESCGKTPPRASDRPVTRAPHHLSRPGAGSPASEGATKLIMLHLHMPGRRRALTVPAAVRVPGPPAPGLHGKDPPCMPPQMWANCSAPLSPQDLRWPGRNSQAQRHKYLWCRVYELSSSQEILRDPARHCVKYEYEASYIWPLSWSSDLQDAIFVVSRPFSALTSWFGSQ